MLWSFGEIVEEYLVEGGDSEGDSGCRDDEGENGVVFRESVETVRFSMSRRVGSEGTERRGQGEGGSICFQLRCGGRTSLKKRRRWAWRPVLVLLVVDVSVILIAGRIVWRRRDLLGN